MHDNFREMMNDPLNRVCFECDHSPITWVSVNNAIFLCTDCSVLHRGFGADLSFVKTINMDTFTDNELTIIGYGGNDQLKMYFQEYGIPFDPPINKYRTKGAHAYRLTIKALATNKKVPPIITSEEACQEHVYQRKPYFSENREDLLLKDPKSFVKGKLRSVASFFGKSKDKLKETIPSLPGNMKDGAGAGMSKMKSVGSWMGKKTWSGVTGAKNVVVKAGKGV
jgi:hypothetical protein